jgi:hypothetical protein
MKSVSWTFYSWVNPWKTEERHFDRLIKVKLNIYCRNLKEKKIIKLVIFLLSIKIRFLTKQKLHIEKGRVDLFKSL